MIVDILILAGAPNQGQLAKKTTESYEALIKIAGRPMIEYVIKAAKDSVEVDKIAVIGPGQKIKKAVAESVDLIIEGESSMVDNIKKGFSLLKRDDMARGSDRFVLLLTSDIPLISGEIIDKYISLCSEGKADIYFPVISKKITEMKFPGVKRTYVNLSDGIYTGGNIVLIRPSVLPGIIDYISKAISWRKKPFKLSQLLGVKFLLKFFMGNLSLAEIEERITELIGFESRVIITNLPEIGFDIDKPDDLYLMKEKYI